MIDWTEIEKYWHLQYPSSTIRKKVYGDIEYASQFNGEAFKLLYELKNLMQFQNLKQLRMVRFFNDGTSIVASSHFGEDLIEIFTPSYEMLEGTIEDLCNLTLINVPEKVAPMRFPGEIKEFEIEGIDYYKTYYLFEIKQGCQQCVVKWPLIGFCELPAEAYRTSWTLQKYTEKLCNPFFFYNPDVKSRWDVMSQEKKSKLKPTPDYTDNHCLYSLVNCAAEIISRGEDELGTYIIWKAYTEYSYANPWLFNGGNFSRNGYGIMDLMPYVGERELKEDGSVNFTGEYDESKKKYEGEICSSHNLIEVDCCEKPENQRTVKMWDEGCIAGLGATFMVFDGHQYYETPEESLFITLYNCAERFKGGGYAGFFLLPYIQGGCIPFEWEWDGPGKLSVADYGVFASIQFPDDYEYHCTHKGTLTVHDRCNKKDQITFKSCCEVSEPLSIAYESLNLYCKFGQVLKPWGGCPPYTWSLVSGGGTLTPYQGSLYDVLYNAPDSNPYCQYNPTVKLEDCCGNSVTLSFVINCSSMDSPVMDISHAYPQYCCDFPQYNLCYWDQVPQEVECYYYSNTAWRCDNSIYQNIYGRPNPCESQCYSSQATMHGAVCPMDTGFKNTPSSYCCNDCKSPYHLSVYLKPYACLVGYEGEYGLTCIAGKFYDMRTTQQKQEGCCPYNPLTGEPL